jgi:hypothetical protein
VVTSRRRAALQRASQQRPCCLGVAPREDEHVDDLAVLIDRSVEVHPAAGNLT